MEKDGDGIQWMPYPELVASEKGTYEIIYKRLGLRQGHFASEKLLASQFAILEEPEDGVAVDVEQSPEVLVEEIRRRLGLKAR